MDKKYQLKLTKGGELLAEHDCLNEMKPIYNEIRNNCGPRHATYWQDGQHIESFNIKCQCEKCNLEGNQS